MLKRRVTILSTLLLLAPLAVAHHSDAAYDKSVTKTATGTLKEFDWSSPHAGVRVEYKNEKGEMAEIFAITYAPLQLIHQGFTPKDFKPGQKVEIMWHPAREGTGGVLVSLTLEDGRVLRGGGAPGPPTAAPPAPKP